MLTKIISKEYTKVLTKGVVIDMVTEILGCLDMIYADACDKENVKLLHAHKQIFIHTVENELDDKDKITMYSYAQKICLDILMNRKYNKEIRKIIHRWCGRLENRKRELEREGYYALVKAHEKAREAIIAMIKLEQDKPDTAVQDRLYLILKDLEKLI